MRRQCQITVKRIIPQSRFRLRCQSGAGDNPIGSRLERGTPMPEVKDSYETEEEAQAAADKLQAYIDDYEKRRKPKRRGKRRRSTR